MIHPRYNSITKKFSITKRPFIYYLGILYNAGFSTLAAHVTDCFAQYILIPNFFRLIFSTKFVISTRPCWCVIKMTSLTQIKQFLYLFYRFLFAKLFRGNFIKPKSWQKEK